MHSFAKATACEHSWDRGLFRGSFFDSKLSKGLPAEALAQEGELSEWLKEHAWKVCILERVSRVRIPHSPLSIESEIIKSL